MTFSSSKCSLHECFPTYRIFYRSDAYSETTELRSRQPIGQGDSSGEANRPQGLMGREVASQSFLRALLRSGQWSLLETILHSEADRSSLTSLCAECLSKSQQPRRVHITLQSELDVWLREPTADVLSFPYPPDAQFARARSKCASADHSAPRVAFSGVTHTLCSKNAIDALWQFLTGPWYPFDRLVCTSQSVIDMVRAVVDAMRTYLIQRHGSAPELQIGLECIPLGVDTEHHRPATAAQRHEARRRLGIGHDRIAFLFVGRLSHHSKAQPFVTFRAAQVAAERLGRDVVLIQCGWYSNPAVREAYESTARQVAPNVRVMHVDGLDPWWRQHVWDAADVFISLADSIQETFGLTVIEAMAHGLPVIASDWNGYRDTVQHGVTGLLTPTFMQSGSLETLAEQFVASEVTYDQFLAVASQATVVSVPDACEQFAQLACNPALRARLGSAGRAHVSSHFAWPIIIERYEGMWQRQRDELRDYRTTKQRASIALAELPSRSPIYPRIEVAFQGYPTRWLDKGTQLRKTADARELKAALRDRLRNHSVAWARDMITQSAYSIVCRNSSLYRCSPRTYITRPAISLHGCSSMESLQPIHQPNQPVSRG